ncbi:MULTISPECIES: hypothetical protein [Cupriavidus]|jgi:hypothetical protein|uniref:Adhesin n=3 Tax=Cupriavidus campinensis TaxID=151783 RepID=A0AAE9I615_9BURK|nr:MULTISPECIES: hypothetical protein [Cupriavidus]TSP14253.1 hypothetical protein FGG12_00895 [Cupriavidus campinensis]URF05710.1 hypothetical protein M5D45_07915 [Cupriavidus campinensis]
MTSRNRESLKRYFREGALPDEDHFADLIDSMLNMSDEGFRKTVERGFEVYSAAGHDALISFFRDHDPERAAWRFELGGARDALLVRGRAAPADGDMAAQAAEPDPALLCLDPAQRVGIGTAQPRTRLDVAGTVRSEGRQGAFTRAHPVPLRADGHWQDLTDDLEGCQAFEVVAGAGLRGKGRFGLVHAIAMNTYNPTLGLFDFLNRKRGIRSTHGYYSRRCDRLELRWAGTSGRNASYRLQIRTGCDFGPDVLIQAQITQLWTDPHMDGGQP